MNINKDNLLFKSLIILLFLFLFGSVYYVYQLTLKNNLLTTENDIVFQEKATIVKNLEALKKNYSALQTENSDLKVALDIEKNKISEMIADLKTSSNQGNNVSKWRLKYFDLSKKFSTFLMAYNDLQKQNNQLLSEKNNTKSILSNTNKTNDSLENKNNAMQKKITQASKIGVVNLQTYALNENESGMIAVVDKASKTNYLNVSFSIPENNLTEKGIKNYYVQIIDTKNNVLGDKKTKKFTTKELPYSFLKNVDYKNKAIDVNENISVSNLSSGIYTIIIYEDDKSVAKTMLDLK